MRQLLREKIVALVALTPAPVLALGAVILLAIVILTGTSLIESAGRFFFERKDKRQVEKIERAREESVTQEAEANTSRDQLKEKEGALAEQNKRVDTQARVVAQAEERTKISRRKLDAAQSENTDTTERTQLERIRRLRSEYERLYNNNNNNNNTKQ